MKWIVLYYTFFFLFGSYMVLQIVCTSLIFLLSNSAERSISISGFNVTIDGEYHQIWNLPEFYYATLLSTLVIATLTFLVTRFIIMDNPFRYLGLQKIRASHFKWVIYSAIVLVSGILFLELMQIKPTVIISAETTSKKILLVAGMVVFAPFIEELLFRGFLLTRMSNLLTDKTQWIAVLIVSLLFAGLHFQYDIVVMLYIVVIAIFMAVMKLKTDNLWLPIGFHIAGNLYAALPILLQ